MHKCNKDGKKVKEILLLLDQCLLPFFIKTPAAMIVFGEVLKKLKGGVNFKTT